MSKKVLIFGADGFLGANLVTYLANRGYIVAGYDNLCRRELVSEEGGISVIPIYAIEDKKRAFKKQYGHELEFMVKDCRSRYYVKQILKDFNPDTIVYLAEIPSAPYSMRDHESMINTVESNISGRLTVSRCVKEVCPDVPIIAIGTMGEFQANNIKVAEGLFDFEFDGRVEKNTIFPRRGGSIYHTAKIANTYYMEFFTRCWGLTVTECQQGIVYGITPESVKNEKLQSRLDVTEAFGTVMNRFCAQAAIGYPLTVFGNGGMTRAFLPISDSMQCLKLLIDNPPKKGTYRSVNQFDDAYSIISVAKMVQSVCIKEGWKVPEIRCIDNPRMENEKNYFVVEKKILHSLGYKPKGDHLGTIYETIKELKKYTQNIERNTNLFVPRIGWK